jgi:hypothetical protein
MGQNYIEKESHLDTLSMGSVDKMLMAVLPEKGLNRRVRDLNRIYIPMRVLA